jgi:hypothetical protein
LRGEKSVGTQGGASGRCVDYQWLLLCCSPDAYGARNPSAWNNHRPETIPMALIPAMFGVQAGPGNSALYCVAMQDEDTERLALRLVPCSCGTTFSVAEDYDRQGTHLRSFLVCPNCGKRHDPKNRLLRIGYERAGYWKVDDC